MATADDGTTIFRNAFEERANQIAVFLEAEGRFGHLLSFDYSDPTKMTVTGIETAGGRPMVFVLTLAKRDAAYVDRELPKAIDTYDRAG